MERFFEIADCDLKIHCTHLTFTAPNEDIYLLLRVLILIRQP